MQFFFHGCKYMNGKINGINHLLFNMRSKCQYLFNKYQKNTLNKNYPSDYCRQYVNVAICRERIYNLKLKLCDGFSAILFKI